jgi:hypothetical protein
MTPNESRAGARFVNMHPDLMFTVADAESFAALQDLLGPEHWQTLTGLLAQVERDMR